MCQISREWEWKRQGLLRVTLETLITELLPHSTGQSWLQDKPRFKEVEKLYHPLVTSCKSMCTWRWEGSVTTILQVTIFTPNHITWRMVKNLHMISLQYRKGATINIFGHLKCCHVEGMLYFFFYGPHGSNKICIKKFQRASFCPIQGRTPFFF